jgi:hypothetical protein
MRISPEINMKILMKKKILITNLTSEQAMKFQVMKKIFKDEKSYQTKAN